MRFAKIHVEQEYRRALFKAECEDRGRSYAMDAMYDYFEEDEEDPGEIYGRYAGRAS